MRPSGDRRPTLADSLVLVAASALGLGAWKAAFDLDATTPFDGSIWSCYFHALLFATPLVAMWTAAIVLLHLRRPRPPLRSLGQRPGLVLSIAALLGLADGLVKGTGHALYSPSSPADSILHSVTAMIPGEVGLAVVGAFAALALAGRRRPQPIWTDRAGWWLGLVWVGMLVLSWSRIYLAALL